MCVATRYATHQKVELKYFGTPFERMEFLFSEVA